MRPRKEALIRLYVEKKNEVVDVDGASGAGIGGEDGGKGVEDEKGDVG